MDFDRMLNYCAALDKHNDRAWFHENHKWYEAARGDYIALLELLRFTIADSAPLLARDILPMQARDWMYRVARDMRYSRDRPPYDPAFRAYISMDRKSWMPIGYFLRICPGGSCFGTGLWCEDTATCNQVRSYILTHDEEWEDILRKNRLTVTGDKLKKTPRGFDETHPAAEWTKYKNWSVLFDIPDEDLLSFDDFSRRIHRLVKRTEPLRLFLLDAARGGTSPTFC